MSEETGIDRYPSFFLASKDTVGIGSDLVKFETKTG
jgi:hypothetical protein